MRDHEDLIRAAFSDIRPKTSNEEFVHTIQERSDIMENKKKRLGKPFIAVIAVAAALAAATVTVGAATNWDIASIFTANNQQMREENEKYLDIDEIKQLHPILYGFEVPEGAQVDGTDPEKEYEVLQTLSHSIDKTVETDDYIIHTVGYICDGSSMMVLYEVTYRNGRENLDPDNIFAELAVLYEVHDDAKSISAGSNTRTIRQNGDSTLFCGDIDLSNADGTSGSAVLELMTLPKREPLASYNVKLAVPEGVTLTMQPDMDIASGIGINYTKLTDIKVSPYHIRMRIVTDINCANDPRELDDPEMNSNDCFVQMPIYITYKDGTVVDTSGYANGCMVEKKALDGGLFEYRLKYPTRGNMIYAGEIKSIQIYNDVLDVN